MSKKYKAYFALGLFVVVLLVISVGMVLTGGPFGLVYCLSLYGSRLPPLITTRSAEAKNKFELAMPARRFRAKLARASADGRRRLVDTGELFGWAN